MTKWCLIFEFSRGKRDPGAPNGTPWLMGIFLGTWTPSIVTRVLNSNSLHWIPRHFYPLLKCHRFYCMKCCMDRVPLDLNLELTPLCISSSRWWKRLHEAAQIVCLCWKLLNHVFLRRSSTNTARWSGYLGNFCLLRSRKLPSWLSYFYLLVITDFCCPSIICLVDFSLLISLI